MLYGLTVTFASIDWMMSLEPPWFSSIYGFMMVTGQFLAAMAFAILVTAWLARSAPWQQWRPRGSFTTWAICCWPLCMLWAYMAFSQFLIIWYGNLPEEIVWYVHRAQGGWNWVGMVLLVLHFALPFVLLLSRRTKRQVQRLTSVAALVLGMHLVDIYWLVMPAFFPERLHVHWLDVVTPVAMGGLWLAAFCWQLQRRSLLPAARATPAGGGTAWLSSTAIDDATACRPRNTGYQCPPDRPGRSQSCGTARRGVWR